MGNGIVHNCDPAGSWLGLEIHQLPVLKILLAPSASWMYSLPFWPSWDFIIRLPKNSFKKCTRLWKYKRKKCKSYQFQEKIERAGGEVIPLALENNLRDVKYGEVKSVP